MAIRCIFRADNGCLVEFNTTRPPAVDEIVGYWDKTVLPPNGIIYDTNLNVVREATDSEARLCNQSQPGQAGHLQTILVTISREQILCSHRWVKILWDTATVDVLDPASSVRLEPAFWFATCQVTPLGTAVIRKLRMRLVLNGQILCERWYGGIYYQRRGVSFSVEYFQHVDDPSQLEVHVYSERSFKISTDTTLTYLRLLKIEG